MREVNLPRNKGKITIKDIHPRDIKVGMKLAFQLSLIYSEKDEVYRVYEVEKVEFYRDTKNKYRKVHHWFIKLVDHPYNKIFKEREHSVEMANLVVE